MVHDEKLVRKFNADDNRRTTMKATRDVFKYIPRRLLGPAKRVRVDRLAFAQNDANFNESTSKVEENGSMKQLCYDEHVNDLNKLRGSSEKDDAFEFLFIQFIELKRFLPRPKFEEFY